MVTPFYTSTLCRGNASGPHFEKHKLGQSCNIKPCRPHQLWVRSIQSAGHLASQARASKVWIVLGLPSSWRKDSTSESPVDRSFNLKPSKPPMARIILGNDEAPPSKVPVKSLTDILPPTSWLVWIKKVLSDVEPMGRQVDPGRVVNKTNLEDRLGKLRNQTRWGTSCSVTGLTEKSSKKWAKHPLNLAGLCGSGPKLWFEMARNVKNQKITTLQKLSPPAWRTMFFSKQQKKCIPWMV